MGASGLVPDSYRRALCGALRVPRCLRQAACLPNGTPLRALPTQYAALLSPTVSDALHPFLRRLCVQRRFPRGFAVFGADDSESLAVATALLVAAEDSLALVDSACGRSGLGEPPPAAQLGWRADAKTMAWRLSDVAWDPFRMVRTQP